MSETTDGTMTESDQHISCQEVVELVTGYLESELPAAETALFEQHSTSARGVPGTWIRCAAPCGSSAGSRRRKPPPPRCASA